MTKPLEPSNLLTFQPSFYPSSLPLQSSKPSNLSTFQPSNLPTFQLSNILALQTSNLTTLHFCSYFQNQKCLEMGENVFSHFQTLFAVSPVSGHFFSYFQIHKCLEMGKNGFSFSPVSRHFLLFLLFLDTFSLISRPKSVQKWEKMEFRFLPFLDTFCHFSCFQTLFLLFLPLHHYIYIVIINNPTGGHFFVTYMIDR